MTPQRGPFTERELDISEFVFRMAVRAMVTAAEGSGIPTPYVQALRRAAREILATPIRNWIHEDLNAHAHEAAP